MNKCIEHLPDMPMVMIRQDYIELCRIIEATTKPCPDYNCVSAILNYFEHWLNYHISKGQSSTFTYHSEGDVAQALCNIWGRNKIGDCMRWLVRCDLLIWKADRNKYNKKRHYIINADLVNSGLTTLKNRLFKIKESTSQNQSVEGLELSYRDFENKPPKKEIINKDKEIENEDRSFSKSHFQKPVEVAFDATATGEVLSLLDEPHPDSDPSAIPASVVEQYSAVVNQWVSEQSPGMVCFVEGASLKRDQKTGGVIFCLPNTGQCDFMEWRTDFKTYCHTDGLMLQEFGVSRMPDERYRLCIGAGEGVA